MSSLSLAISRLLREVRLDMRAPDPEKLAQAVLDAPAGAPVHPVSGMPVFFGARNAPASVTRIRWLGLQEKGVRLEWIRDRLDPVHHVWGRHTCRFWIPRTPAETDPFRLPPPETFLPPEISDFFENAFLQEAEAGVVQALSRPDSLHVEFAARVRLGPLWSAHACPDSLRDFFTSHPDSLLLHVPMETVLSQEGPSCNDDPLAPEPVDPAKIGDLRRRFGIRVLRSRRFVFFGSPDSLARFRQVFAAAPLEHIPTGETPPAAGDP